MKVKMVVVESMLMNKLWKPSWMFGTRGITVGYRHTSYTKQAMVAYGVMTERLCVDEVSPSSSSNRPDDRGLCTCNRFNFIPESPWHMGITN
jgi:hypothetical protein